MAALTVIQRRSRNGANPKQLATLRSLGLRRIGHTIQVEDNEQAAACCTRCATSSRSRRTSEPAKEDRRSASGCTARAGSRQQAPAKARGGGAKGPGTGKTSGAGRRAQAHGRARRAGPNSRRPDADPHAHAKAARTAHEKSMPFEPFRTHTQPVNISSLESRFDAAPRFTIELMKANGLATRKGVPVKVLAKGELGKALTVHAHAFSVGARERIEAAGGSCKIVDV